MKILLLFVLTTANINFTAFGKEKLRWAADTESGAPFVYHDPNDLNKLRGFEYDIVMEISKILDMDPEFVQNSWDGLVPGLQRDQYDIIINGVEITEERKKQINFSDPYYITFEQLVVRKTQDAITSLSDLKGKKVGTLRFSVAENILKEHDGIEILGYEEETNAYNDLVIKRSDAVLLDAPIALYYAKPNADLKLVGTPIGQLLYGIGVSKGNTLLLNKINSAIETLIKNGKLREIYDRWNLWNNLMANMLNDFSPSRTPPTNYQEFLQTSGKTRSFFERLNLYISFVPVMTKGAITTLNLSIISMALAVLMGLLLALTRLYASAPLSWMANFYIELIRGTPLLIQLFFIFYALPHLGITLSPFVAAVIGLGFNYAAYEAENYRAGIQSIPQGQWEAATSLGFNKWQTLRYVVVPQAVRLVLPPVTNDFISLLKDSSLVSVITMVELAKVYGQLASTYYDYVGTGIMVSVFYLLLGLPFVKLLRYVEKKYHVPYGTGKIKI